MKYEISLEVTYEHFVTFDENSRRTQWITDQIAGYVQAGRSGTLYDINRNIVGTITAKEHNVNDPG